MSGSTDGHRVLHVISHTHWDREWYLTFQQFRLRLVQLVDRLMDLLDRDLDFRFFLLDAQTVCLEDYLEVKPANRERLERFLREGRIITGPWYVQNDLHLTSGEATIRNLLIGHRMTAEFAGPGRVMKVGYLPDQFGLISQMPQILRGFGIETAVQGRGYDVKEAGSIEYWWQGPDGSRVLASNMAFWYNNLERIPGTLEAAVARVDEVEGLMAPLSRSRHLLFMNGVDHFEAQQDLTPMMEAVNELPPRPRSAGAGIEGRGKLIHSTLTDYFAGLKAEVDAGLGLPVHEGELRDGPSLGGLAGTLSSRVCLKQANARCQTLLEKYAEPLTAIAWRMGADYPREYLTWAWKRLMRNHPHDSICGCSQDQVHREMEVRFEEVQQVLDELVTRAYGRITEGLPESAPVELPGRQTTFAAFNPLPFERSDVVEVTLDFALGEPGRERCEVDESSDVEHIGIFDDQGQPVLHYVVSCERVQTRVLSPTVLPMAQVVRRFVIQVQAEGVPPLGFRTFRAVAQPWSLAQGQAGSTIATGATAPSQKLSSRGDDEESGAFGAISTDGEVSVSLGGSVYAWGQAVLEDGGDAGDEYVYRAPRRDVVVGPSHGQVEVIEDTPLTEARRWRSTMMVPAGLTPDREARSAERVQMPVESTIRRVLGRPWIEAEITVHNTAGDHRVRALFSVDADTETTFAGQPFDVVEGPRVPLEQLGTLAAQHPHEGWVSAWGTCEGPCCTGESQGITVFTEGLYEHELLRTGGPEIAVTLLRCTDRITMATQDPLGHDRCPDAQCPGTHTFRLGVMPHEANWEEAKVWKHAAAFAAPMLAMQTPEDSRRNPDHNADAARVFSSPSGGGREGAGTETMSDERGTMNAESGRSALPDAVPQPLPEGGEMAGHVILEPDCLVLSAYKLAQDRDTLIVRFWNTGTAPVLGKVGVPGAGRAWRTDLNETRLAEAPLNGEAAAELTVAPKEIVTLEFA